MKKILSIMLSLLMVFSVIPFTMMSVSADGEVVYQTIVDMSDYDGATLGEYASPWFTEGLTRSYNIGKTAYSYDAETDSMKITRGAWDPCGLYYFDKENLPLAFSDSLGFRVWLKGDADSGADVTSQNNFLFAVDTVDETGAHVVYGAYGYDNPSYKIVVPAEGAWVEIRWADFAKSWKVIGKTGMQANRPSFYMSGSAIAPETILSKVDGFVVGFKSIGSDKIYYIGDMQLIKPAVNVTFDNNTISGYTGQVVEIPEPTTEGVIAYSDGEKLYYPGEEYTITGEITFTNIKEIIDSSSDHDFVFDTEAKTYTGSEICPAVTSATLVEGEDYIVSYENNVNAGTGTIKVSGIGNCFIDLSADFTISKKEFAVSDFSVAADGLTYSGEALEPTVSSDVFADDDFTVVYHNNVNASENAYAIVEATGKNGYGAVEIPFSILQKEIEEDMFVFDLENKTFTNVEITPDVTSETLAIGDDYKVGYSTNINVGIASLYVEGIGNYCGRIDKTFEIVPEAITEENFTVDTDDKFYTAKEICPQVTSTLGENDYEVDYSNNVDTGVATITVTGKGNYAGTLTYEFVILQKEIVAEDFTIDLEDKVYTGEEIKPSVTSDVLKAEDYVVAYENNIDVGTATIIITGMGNCKGQFTKTFTINKKEITVDDFTVDTSDKVYTGVEIKPEVTSTLGEDNYTVAYNNNVTVGTATITIQGVNNCEGTVTFTFEVVKKAFENSYFSLSGESFVYTGEEIKPEVISAVIPTEAYEVFYSDNVNVGTATVTIVTRDDNYSGEAVLTFTITEKAIEDDDFVLEGESFVYTGEEIEPEVISEELEAGVDYTVAYESNVNVGIATVTITGEGNYAGTVTKTFEITPKAITLDDFILNLDAEVYTGLDVLKAIESQLELDVDYTVEYKDNVNVGTATITFTGIGNYTGTESVAFEITPKEITVENFVVDNSNVVYTGKAFTKSVLSGLELGKDYTVEFKNNVNVGVASVVITGIGNYKGVLTYNFTIAKPKVNKIKKVTAKSTAKKKVTVKWKKVSGANGYVITYSMNKKFKKGKKFGTKTVEVKNAKAAKRIIKKLKSGNKYFVKVAAYKNYKDSNGETLKVIGKYKKIKKAVIVK